jgi:hypothetical protein
MTDVNDAKFVQNKNVAEAGFSVFFFFKKITLRDFQVLYS